MTADDVYQVLKDFIKNDVIGKVVIHTTDEDRSKAVMFESFFNLLGLLDPNSKEALAIKDKIMDMLSISREQLALYAQEEAQLQQTQPQGGDVETEQIAAQDTQTKVIPS